MLDMKTRYSLGNTRKRECKLEQSSSVREVVEISFAGRVVIVSNSFKLVQKTRTGLDYCNTAVEWPSSSSHW